jgi:hypothetical protein
MRHYGYTVMISALSVLQAGGCARSPQDEYAGRFAHAVCDQMESCCQQNGLTFDHGNCVLGGAGFVQAGVDQAEIHHAQYDSKAADACVAGAAWLAASCLPTGADPGIAQACGSVFVGTKSPGEACTSDFDCAPGDEGRGKCYAQSSDGSGVCVLMYSPAQQGDTCLAQSGMAPPRVLADCERSDLQCDQGSATCKPLTAIGAGCPGFTTCVKDAYCDANQICAKRKASGEDCSKDLECAIGACISGKCAQNALGTLTPCTGAH